MERGVLLLIDKIIDAKAEDLNNFVERVVVRNKTLHFVLPYTTSSSYIQYNTITVSPTRNLFGKINGCKILYRKGDVECYYLFEHRMGTYCSISSSKEIYDAIEHSTNQYFDYLHEKKNVEYIKMLDDQKKVIENILGK